MSRGSVAAEDYGSIEDIPMFSFTNLSYLTEKNKNLAATHRRTHSADLTKKPSSKEKTKDKPVHRNSNM